MNHKQIKQPCAHAWPPRRQAPPIVWGENALGVYDTPSLQYVTPDPPYGWRFYHHAA